MNTGIQDASNLAWKLALVHRGLARSALLDSYEAERRPVARRVVRATHLLTSTLTLRNPAARTLRNLVLPRVTSLEPVRERIRGNLSQIRVGYRRSPIVREGLSEARDGTPETLASRLRPRRGPTPGDRAPDATLLRPDTRELIRLSELTKDIGHGLLLFHGITGRAAESLRRFRDIAEQVWGKYSEQITVHLVLPVWTLPPGLSLDDSVFLDPDRTLHRLYGAHEARLYLMRPDGYVAFRGGADSAEKLHTYLGAVLGESGNVLPTPT
jgi:hypothetical protein